MTSGHKLTERQRDSILRLVGYETEEGDADGDRSGEQELRGVA
jgi:hypothetical protein